MRVPLPHFCLHEGRKIYYPTLEKRFLSGVWGSGKVFSYIFILKKKKHESFSFFSFLCFEILVFFFMVSHLSSSRDTTYNQSVNNPTVHFSTQATAKETYNLKKKEETVVYSPGNVYADKKQTSKKIYKIKAALQAMIRYSHVVWYLYARTQPAQSFFFSFPFNISTTSFCLFFFLLKIYLTSVLQIYLMTVSTKFFNLSIEMSSNVYVETFLTFSKIIKYFRCNVSVLLVMNSFSQGDIDQGK